MARKSRTDNSSFSGDNLSSAVRNALIRDVAPEVEDILKKHIQSDIYDVYTPKEGAWIGGETYERRHVLEQEITSEIIDDYTLLVTSTASANDSVVPGYEFSNKYAGAFLELLESGNMGIWNGGFARPAVSNAQGEVDNSASIRSALQNGVRREIERILRTSR